MAGACAACGTMWVRDLRAVTFSDSATLRRPFRSEALAAGIHEALLVRGISIPRATFSDAWARATRRRDEERWVNLKEETTETTLAAILPDSVKDVAGIVTAAVESAASSCEWFPDALPTLDFLHEAGYRIALVGDSAAPLGESWRARMAPWVDVVVLSRDVGHVKPHPVMFKEVVGRVGALPKQILHIGDQLVGDIFGAKGVGLRASLLERVPRDPPSRDAFAWLKRVHSLEPNDITPDLKIRTLEEIPAVLEQFG